MFVANIYVDVYREIGTPSYSEYDDSASEKQLVFRKVPMQITPFAPKFDNGAQTTNMLGNSRNNYALLENDELRSVDGRKFKILTVERTSGAFYGNSRIYQMIEYTPLG